MTVALLGIGTELTRGDISNTNGGWLAKELTELGFEVAAIDVVDDYLPRIVDAIRRLSERHEVVICTGGLGPTTDDITREAAAAVLGVELRLDATSLVAIEARMSRFGRSMSPSNRNQAAFPEGAQIIANDFGTAPGFAIFPGYSKVFFLPGVPQEMKSMFAACIVDKLGLPQARTPYELLFRTFGLGESAVNDRLVGIEAQFGITIGYRVHFPEVDVKLLCRDPSSEAARHRAQQASLVVRERLGDYIYAEGPSSLPEVIGAKLVALKQKFALAESCTGGLVSALITEHPGVSPWYAGAVVCYGNEVKSRVLGVSPGLLETHGAVSKPVADAMVEGVCRITSADYALAITGLAGPSGGSDEKPVGTVCFAVKTPNGTRLDLRLLQGDRTRIQRLAAFHGLKMVLSALTHSNGF